MAIAAQENPTWFIRHPSAHMFPYKTISGIVDNNPVFPVAPIVLTRCNQATRPGIFSSQSYHCLFCYPSVLP